MAEFGLDPKTVAVRLCDGLPTSFVRRGHDTGAGDGVQHVICLQRELPPERMGLVLRHEGEHIKMRHPWWKMANAISMALFWWSPLHWAAYRLTNRDMELACDRAVLNRLEPEGRREYARMLTELARRAAPCGAACPPLGSATPPSASAGPPPGSRKRSGKRPCPWCCLCC